MSTLAHPPRVVAVFRRDDLPRGARPVTLALWHVGDPGNVGTLLRAADAFGAGIALSEGCADPTGPKAVRASMGALFRVPLSGVRRARGRRVALVAAAAECRSPSWIPAATSCSSSARSGRGCRRRCSSAARSEPRSRSPAARESLNVAMAGRDRALRAGSRGATSSTAARTKRSGPLSRGRTRRFAEPVSLSSASSNRPFASGLLPLRPTARSWFRPTRAPCSAQGGTYANAVTGSRPSRQLFCRNLRLDHFRRAIQTLSSPPANGRRSNQP